MHIFVLVVDISTTMFKQLELPSNLFSLIQSKNGYKMTVSSEYTIVFEYFQDEFKLDYLHLSD